MENIQEVNKNLVNDKGRKHFLDNVRWVTVLCVLVYHVFYYYSGSGYGKGGRFCEWQWQDVFLYLLYPWFMLLLFLVAGISSYYSLEHQSLGTFLLKRTRKLLLPCTLGLFFLQLLTCYFAERTAGALDSDASVLDCISGITGIHSLINRIQHLIGHLWFIVDLWFFSLLMVIIRSLERGRLRERVGRFFAFSESEKVNRRVALDVLIVVGGWLIIWATTQFNDIGISDSLIRNLWRGYHPINYFTAFLLGYFVFSHDSVQERVSRLRIPLLIAALIAGGCFAFKYMKATPMWGSPEALGSVLGSTFVWLTILAMLGCFKAWADKTNRFATYMTKSSFGLYVVHYFVISVVGFVMHFYLELPPWAMYVCMLFSVLLLSPLVYEIVKRVPFVRWCMLGMKKSKSK